MEDWVTLDMEDTSFLSLIRQSHTHTHMHTSERCFETQSTRLVYTETRASLEGQLMNVGRWTDSSCNGAFNGRIKCSEK